MSTLAPGGGDADTTEGGYDPREPENVAVHQSLVALADKLGLSHITADGLAGMAASSEQDADVAFLLSVPSQLKEMLLKSATLLVYTPTFEHFGIVPLEAMLAGAPVLASDTGGPKETVLDGKTGWLRDADDVHAWAEIIDKALVGMSDSELQGMGARGRESVRQRFSKEKMAKVLEEELEGMAQRPRAAVWEIQDLLLLLGVSGVLLVAFGMWAWRVYVRTNKAI